MTPRRRPPRESLRTLAPTPKEAVALQRRLARRVRRDEAWAAGGVRLVAGADVGLRGGVARAAVCVLALPGLELVESARVERPLSFPYVPGLLSFREIPALLDAFDRVRQTPDVVLVDGHGVAHPRRIGIASHLGLELDLPTIGCAKSLLCGEHREPGPRRGARTQIRHAGEVVGACLRTRDGVRPVYVSVGHRVDLPEAVRLVLRCAPRYRLPEPTRLADQLAGRP